MNNLDKNYQELLQDILDNGVEKDTRNGKTLSVFGRTIRHKMSEGFTLLTTKKMYFKGIVTELLWFLRGDTNIKYLVDNDCHIWDGDCYARYMKLYEQNSNDIEFCYEYGNYSEMHREDPNPVYSPYIKEQFIEQIKTDAEFAKKWGELGPIYGKQWRNWQYIDLDNFVNLDNCDDPELKGRGVFYKTDSIDQIDNLINDLKHNPDSRRLMVTAWNPGDLDEMLLPPCHYSFQLYTRELTWEEQVQWVMKNTDVEWENLYIVEEVAKDTTPKRAISLLFNMRSTDVPLGLPFNIASYGLLLEILGKTVNMIPEELIANLGDAHIYTNQIEGIKEQLTRKPFELPKLIHRKSKEFYKSLSEDISLINHLENTDFTLEDYKSHTAIKMPLSN